MNKLHKRAVSPMIATVLLIFFAIALGAVIMNWGSNYAEIQQDVNQKVEEANLKCERFVSISTVTGESCIQATRKSFKTKIRNDGQLTIDGFRVILIGKKNFETQFFDMDSVRLESGSSNDVVHMYDYSRLGDLQTLELIPKISLGVDGKLHECPQRVEVQNLPEC